jgi:dTMP kinase
MRGTFITFEGGEGSGKSTQIALLEGALKSAKLPYIKTREPGGSDNAELIRKLLVSGSHEAWNPVAETLLFYAARLEHVTKIIKPAIASGKVVICDRFVDSTVVYQGIGKGLSPSYIMALHRLTLGDFMPDLTVMLDIDPTVGLKRAEERRGDETRFENMEMEFHQQVRAGFLQLAKQYSARCAVLAAEQDKNKLHREIIALVNQRLGLKLAAHG